MHVTDAQTIGLAAVALVFAFFASGLTEVAGYFGILAIGFGIGWGTRDRRARK